MKKLSVLLAIALIAGCSGQAKNDFAAFYTYHPKSILVVPIVNETPELTASPTLITSITRPLAERGYYVFPVYLTGMIFRDFGLFEAGHIHLLPVSRFYELFGADAVLFVTIKDWSTKYLFLASTVVVEMEYLLKDTKTGTVLWENKQSYEQSSSGKEPVSMFISAAINAVATDYLPLARKANFMAFKAPKGIPAGHYHPDYLKDQDEFFQP